MKLWRSTFLHGCEFTWIMCTIMLQLCYYTVCAGSRRAYNAVLVLESPPLVGPGCVLCPRIDPLRFLAGCRRRWLNLGLVVALGFFSLLDRACFCVIFFGLCVHALFSSLSFWYQYQCNWFPGKIRPRNGILCVEWDVKPCSNLLNSLKIVNVDLGSCR